MSDIPPDNPAFNRLRSHATDTIALDSEFDRIEQLKKKLPQLLEENVRGGRAQRFYPYMLIRYKAGDRGDRPISAADISQTGSFTSPDIWCTPGAPSVTPAIPPQQFAVGFSENTLYAHVWNLGRAPVAGVAVEFYWLPAYPFFVDPGLVDNTIVRPIGMARTNLGARGSPDCHGLVKCPVAFTPLPFLIGDSTFPKQMILVRVSCIGDSISTTHPWDTVNDRHVAMLWVVTEPPIPPGS